jgi:hypothetical protein
MSETVYDAGHITGSHGRNIPAVERTVFASETRPHIFFAPTQVRRRSCGTTVGSPQLLAFTFTIAQITLGVNPSPQILPVLLIERSRGPVLTLAARVQLSTAAFIHSGTGIVRICPPFITQIRDHPMTFPKLKILEP